MEHTLGKRIVLHRKRLGLTQDALADKLGVTAQAVSKWENDQSCPDITMLPKLATIFNTTTDALLGIAEDSPAPETAVAEAEPFENNGFHIGNGNWEFQYGSSRRASVHFAALVLLVGCLYFVSSLLQLDVGLWDLIWPSALLVFGIHGVYPKFSVLCLGCIVFGGFFLVNQFIPVPIQLDNRVIIAVVILLIGGALLIDALRKPKKPTVKFSRNINSHDRTPQHSFHINEDSFRFDGVFGDQNQLVTMPLLRSGMINTSFGDYQIDLSGVDALAPECRIEANTSFGDLTIWVPSRFQVRYASSAAFASVDVDGKPDPITAGTIQLMANASFGQITVEYI